MSVPIFAPRGCSLGRTQFFPKNKHRRVSCFAHFLVAVPSHDDVKLSAMEGCNGALHPQRQYGALPAFDRGERARSKRDEDRHKMLLTLLAEEIAKEKKPSG
jgi:hypothetical protein